jgi:hypothetical protein
MSYVTGVVLIMSCAEDTGDTDTPDLLTQINGWLFARKFGNLVLVQEQFGGNKHPQMFVAGGGYNYLPCDEFAAMVLALPWEYPSQVALVLSTEEQGIRCLTVASSQN